MKVLNRGFAEYNMYGVQTERRSTAVSLKDCNVSCGVREVEGVGDLISRLKYDGLNSKEIAAEIKTMVKAVRNRDKDEEFDEGGSAFVMMSLADCSRYHKAVYSHLKKAGATITSWRKNPNSGNKINVVIM